MFSSLFLTSQQLKTLERIGDLWMPAWEEYPSFSQLGCIEYIDDILRWTPLEQLKDLQLLLSILSFFPTLFLKLFLKFVEKGNAWPVFIGTLSRLIHFAFRGIVFSLYYSGQQGSHYKGKNPLTLISYEINRVPRSS